MPQWIYTDGLERYYPSHPRAGGTGVTGIPGGDPVEMDEPPADGRWAPVPVTKPKKTAPAAGPSKKETAGD